MVRLLRFYQQYKIDDFLNMDVATLRVLVNGMNQLEAEEHMKLMDAVSYPHMEKKAQKKSHKKWHKIAYPEMHEHKIIKTSDLELI